MKTEFRQCLAIGLCLAVTAGGCARGAETAPPQTAPSAPMGADGKAAMPAGASEVAAPPPGDPTPGSPAPHPDKAGALATNGPHDASMLVYTAQVALAVFRVDEALTKVELLCRDLGGYLASRQDQAVTIRVPRERFREGLARIEKVGNVLHRNVSAEDVTDQFLDTEIRLKNARAMRDRLEQLLRNAAVKDALEVEKELGRVTEEIERLEGKLKLLSSRIAYSTITVSAQPLDVQPVRDGSALLPFPWLRELGLATLLNLE